MLKAWLFITLIELLVWIQQGVESTRYRFSLTGDSIDRCRNSKPEEYYDKHADISNLNITDVGVDQVFLDGTIKWLQPQGLKWACEARTFYNDRGEWIPGPFNYVTADACNDFNNKEAPWYPLTKYLDGHCPPKKNGVTFMNGTVDLTFESNAKVPFGEYEGEFYLIQIPSKKKLCFSVELSISLA